MNNKRVGLIILLLLLAVGFASVTTNLIINNNVNISAKTDDFSVVFTSAKTEEESTATISDDKKSITYVTKELLNVGDKSELEYTIKNNSSQYDADINLSIGLDSSISDLISITYETIDNTNTVNLPAKDEITGKIRIELIKPAITNMAVSLTVTFDASAISRTEFAYDNYTVRYNGNGAEEGSMDDQIIEYNVNTALLSNQFTRSGYQMIGWTTNPETNETFYQDEQEVNNLTRGGNTIDLYAVWLKTEYDYTGGEQSLIVPVNGIYKLETWGAQGGDGSYGAYGKAGYGSYSVGEINLLSGNQLFINIGGKGTNATVNNKAYSGGYNGGGNSYGWGNTTNGSGGGATHIATSSGILSSLSNNKDKVIIVSGGGGGGGSDYLTNPRSVGQAPGGSAGGMTGGRGSNPANGDGSYGQGGTQTAGGSSILLSRAAGSAGTFGKGGNGWTGGGSGGGSGYYGGGGSSVWGGSGGGSGYIGTQSLMNKHMSCYNCTISDDVNTKTLTNTCSSSTPTVDCAKQGNGYARITFISAS